MTSNDGQRLTVFGLGFREHDTRKMNRVLDHYERLPTNANDRTALFTNLTALAREIPQEEASSIETWLNDGGEFPFVRERREQVPSYPTINPRHRHGFGGRGGRGGYAMGRAPDDLDFDDDEDEDEDEDDDDDMGLGHEVPAYPPPQLPVRSRHRHRGMHRGGRLPRQHNPRQVMNQAGDGMLPQNNLHPGNPLPAMQGHGLPPGVIPQLPQGMPAVPAPGAGARPQVQRGGGLNQPFGGGNIHGAHPYGLDPYLGHGPPAAYHPPRGGMAAGARPQQQMGGGPYPAIGDARLPAPLPNLRGAPAFGIPRPGHHPTAFDRVGPGRRLGEEGEETVPEQEPDTQAFEQIFQGEQHNPGPDGVDEDVEGEEMEYEYHHPYHTSAAQPSVSSAPVDPEPSLPIMECEICYESFPSSNFPDDKITAICDHDAKVCYDCLTQVIEVQVQEGVLGQLNCPSCPAKLAFEDIEAYASREVFERYKYLLSRTKKDFFMCLAPICGAGQTHTGGKEQPLMICNSCDFKICTIHGRPWHEGQTCKEFDLDPSQFERLEEEEATARLLAAEGSRICPSCNQGVTKDFGCDHMACRCGKAWCFICEADWENIIRMGGGAHAVTCQYHPNFVRKRPDQIAAEKNRAFEAVHGGELSQELKQAKATFQESRRAAIRPKALEAAEKRMQEMKGKEKEEPHAQPKKKHKVNLKPAWEEGGTPRHTFS